MPCCQKYTQIQTVFSAILPTETLWLRSITVIAETRQVVNEYCLAGEMVNSVYKVTMNLYQIMQVYCDQTTDGDGLPAASNNSLG